MKDFMTERITKDNGEAFRPSRYTLKSGNEAIVQPYKTYDLFYEITFEVLQKLGAYEDIGTPDECRKAADAFRKVGKKIYSVCYDEDHPDESEVTEFTIIDASANGLVRLEDANLGWVNPDDPEEWLFWTREEAEKKLEELKGEL